LEWGFSRISLFGRDKPYEVHLARKHLIICLFLGMLAVPIYFLDLALLAGGGGSNWINLDFRRLIFWTYIAWLAINVALSSIAVLSFPKSGLLRIHLGSMVLSVILLVTGFVGYGKLLRARAIADQRTFMESRRPLINVIELKGWWYFPDEIYPTEILHPGHADDVRITLYLFKAASGPAAGDITKVFMNSPEQGDDGEYFYGVLPAPSLPAK